MMNDFCYLIEAT